MSMKDTALAMVEEAGARHVAQELAASASLSDDHPTWAIIAMVGWCWVKGVLYRLLHFFGGVTLQKCGNIRMSDNSKIASKTPTNFHYLVKSEHPYRLWIAEDDLVHGQPQADAPIVVLC